MAAVQPNHLAASGSCFANVVALMEGLTRIRGCAAAMRLVLSLPALASLPVNTAAVPGEPKRAAARLPCSQFFPVGPPNSRCDRRIPIFDAWMAGLIEFEPHPYPHPLM